MPRDGAGVRAANKTRRLVIGFLLLILVDAIWVASSELTKYLYNETKFERPFFTTYAKTCMFSIYLIGFMFHRPWRDQCINPLPEGSDEEEEEIRPPADEMGSSYSLLSEPEFEPIQPSSDTESIESSEAGSRASLHEPTTPPDPTPPRGVRFKRVQEVRRMPAEEAAAATLSRLPYDLWLRAQSLVRSYHNKLPVRQVAKLALQFCFVWFLGNLAYSEALLMTSAGIVNVLSSTSSFFTLILASLFPATLGDRFTLSKLCVVLLSVGGVGVVTWVDEGLEGGIVPAGAVWGLVGALSYASYLVLLRRKVDSEEKLDIPMFFGFVGLFSLCLLWPGLYFLHESGLEPFYPLPNKAQLTVILLNGLIGTVLSEYLWLWGCFLTNSLIATLSISLTIPMTVLADRILWEEAYPWTFYLGTAPILLAFAGASLLAHYDNWDPVAAALRLGLAKLCHFPCLILRRCGRRGAPGHHRMRSELDREQAQGLIINS